MKIQVIIYRHPPLEKIVAKAETLSIPLETAADTLTRRIDENNVLYAEMPNGNIIVYKTEDVTQAVIVKIEE